MKTTRILFLTLSLSLSVSILEAQQIFPYPADSSGSIVGKYLPTNPKFKHELSKRTGSAKLIDSVDWFTYIPIYDSISGRNINRFELARTDKYNEFGNLQEVYYYSYIQSNRSRHRWLVITRDSEEKIKQSTFYSGSCFFAINNYDYDTNGNLIKQKGYCSALGTNCIDTTQKPFIFSQYEYTYNNIGKMTSETYSDNRRYGYVEQVSRIEYKYANDSLFSLVYNSSYNQSEKSWEYTDKTQMVYDSTGLIQKEIRFRNYPATQDSIWDSSDTARYNYTFNEKGQMESMQYILYGYKQNERRYTYYPSGVTDSIVENKYDNNIISKYNEDGYIKYIDQNRSTKVRKRWEYHYVGDVVISGMDEKPENNRLILYPNPAVQQITIALNPKEAKNIVRKTEILNLSGQTVWTDNSSYLQKTIDLSVLRPGNYFVRLTTSNGIISTKLFKL